MHLTLAYKAGGCIESQKFEQGTTGRKETTEVLLQMPRATASQTSLKPILTTPEQSFTDLSLEHSATTGPQPHRHKHEIALNRRLKVLTLPVNTQKATNCTADVASSCGKGEVEGSKPGCQQCI